MNRFFVGACLTALTVLPVSSQDSAKLPSFEVASIRPADPAKNGGIARQTEDAQRFTAVNFPLRSLFHMAYGPSDEERVKGAPAWWDVDRFDVVAKAESPTTHAQLLLMLRSLLAERFALTFHMETNVIPVMAMVIGKNASKLRDATDVVMSGDPVTAQSRQQYPMFDKILGRRTMQQLAGMLSLRCAKIRNMQVVDQTGINGEFDLRMQLQPQDAFGTPFDAICDALPQLGLELKAEKLPVEYFVIDHAKKPSGN